MAHYAFIDENNIVVEVITGKNEGEDNIDWEIEYAKFRPGLRCKRTSYNTRGGKHWIFADCTYILSPNQSKSFRKNYAGIGFYYDEQKDAFIAPKLYDSWVFNEDTYAWNPPIPPLELTQEEEELDIRIFWNEDLLKWEKKKKNSSGNWEVYNSI
jgi:hypothetical protein